MTARPQWLILSIGVIGIFMSFLLQGTAHEQIFGKYKCKESLFVTFLQFLGYSSLSIKFFINLIRGKTRLHAPFWFYIITAVTLVGSMALSNFSLERISYPTVVLFRSSKLLPVMFGSFFFLKKRYSAMEVASVLLIVAGLIGMSISDKKVHNKFDTIGLIALITSLCCDAIASNFEEEAFSKYQAPQDEVIAIIYLIGAIMVGAMSIFTGEFVTGSRKCFENPGLVIQIILFSYLGAVGIQFIYLLIKAFGSVITVMVTSLRKAFTVLLSFLLFPDKKFTAYHMASIVSISTGIGLNIYAKKISKESEQMDKKTENYEIATAVDDQNDIGAQSDIEYQTETSTDK